MRGAWLESAPLARGRPVREVLIAVGMRRLTHTHTHSHTRWGHNGRGCITIPRLPLQARAVHTRNELSTASYTLFTAHVTCWHAHTQT